MGRPPKKNDRCPFKDECDMKCEHKNNEIECDYYRYNSCPGKEIEDQEEKREQYAAEHYPVKTDDKHAEAVNLNRKIIMSAQMVQQDLYDMCTGLKQMRDGKLYKELGYQNFEEYVEAETGFTRMQAHRYISIVEKLPGDFVTSMLQIGTTKLALLATLDDAERAEITEKTDVESATVRELKAEIEKLKNENADRQSDNMSLSRQLGELQANYIDVQDDNDELRNEIAELKARPPKQVIIQQKEQRNDDRPPDWVSLKAYNEACVRYQNNIDELEHENLMLTREAHAAKVALEEKTNENAVEEKEEFRFDLYLAQLNTTISEFTAFIDICEDKVGFLKRLHSVLNDVCGELESDINSIQNMASIRKDKK